MQEDLLFQTLAEANQYLQQEKQIDAISGSVLSKQLYTLLIKNVSKDDPLTQEELQELREFRSSLTPDQWKEWLKFARLEKKKLSAKKKERTNEQQAPPLLQQQPNEQSDSNTNSTTKTPIPRNSVRSSIPPPIEELRDLIRRRSFKTFPVKEENHQNRSDEDLRKNQKQDKANSEVISSVTPISTEELKSIIRRESLRLMQQNEYPFQLTPSQEPASVHLSAEKNELNENLSRRPSVAPEIPERKPFIQSVNADPELVSVAKNWNLTEVTPAASTLKESDDEEFKNMEALVNRFHSNQIRKKSVIHPSSNAAPIINGNIISDPNQQYLDSYEEEKEFQSQQPYVHETEEPHRLEGYYEPAGTNSVQEDKRLSNPIHTPYTEGNQSTFKEDEEVPTNDPYEPQRDTYYRRPSLEQIRRASQSIPLSQSAQKDLPQTSNPSKRNLRRNEEYSQHTPDLSFDRDYYERESERGEESPRIGELTFFDSSRKAKPPSASDESLSIVDTGVSLAKQSLSRPFSNSASSSRRPSNASDSSKAIPIPSDKSQFRTKSLLVGFEHQRSSLDLPSPPQTNIPRSTSKDTIESTRAVNKILLPPQTANSKDDRDDKFSQPKRDGDTRNYKFETNEREILGSEETDQRIDDEEEEIVVIPKKEFLQLQRQLLDAAEKLQYQQQLYNTPQQSLKKEKFTAKKITALDGLDGNNSESEIPSTSSNSFQQELPPKITEHLQDNLTNASMSSRRLTSATSAAKYLIKSLNHFQLIGNLHPYESDGLEASKVILSEVVTALEKSKKNVNSIQKQTKKLLTVESSRKNPLEEYEQELHSEQPSVDRRLVPLYSTRSFPKAGKEKIGIAEEEVDEEEGEFENEAYQQEEEIVAEDDNYSEVDEKHPAESLYEISTNLPRVAYEEHFPQPKQIKNLEKPKEQQRQTRSNRKEPSEEEPAPVKSHTPRMSALFQRIDLNSTADNRIPFQNRYGSTENKSVTSDQESNHSYSDGPDRPRSSHPKDDGRSNGAVLYPKENDFNTVFQQSLQKRDEEIEKFQKDQEIKQEISKIVGKPAPTTTTTPFVAPPESSFMNTGELITQNDDSSSASPTVLPKRSRRESKYTHDVNNYTVSFDADDIIQRIQSIDKSLNNQGKVNAKEVFVAPGRRRSIIDPPPGNSPNSDFGTISQDFSKYPNSTIEEQQQQGDNHPVYPGYPFVSTTERPQEPSSNYVPKPNEITFSSSSYRPSTPQQFPTGTIDSPSSTLRMTRNQTTVQDEDHPRVQIEAYKAITQQYPDAIGSDQQRYQNLFDKYRMDSTGSTTRLCLVQGPLVKAYEEYPIRIDLENSTVDVVWRETRITSNSQAFSQAQELLKKTLASPTLPSSIRKKKQLENYYEDLLNTHTTKVLRRERFLFDYIYTGNRATDRLREYIKHRIRYSLTHVINQVFLCTSCGEFVNMDLEPPVALALGSGGGSGVGSAILQEVFRFLSTSMHTNSPANTAQVSIAASPIGSMRKYKSSNPSSYVTTRLVQDHQANRVTMSVVLINGNLMFDLLHPASNPKDQPSPQILKKSSSHHDRIILSNITQIDLLNIYDFERIIGLLLGRRAGIYDTLRNMKQTVKHPSSFLANTAKETLQSQLLNSHATWNAKTPFSSSSSSASVAAMARKKRKANDDSVEIDFGTPTRNGYNTTNASSRRKSQMDIHFDRELEEIEDNTVLPNEEAVEHPMDDQMHVNMNTSSLLITFTISYGSILAKKRNNLTFRVVCPCGDSWYDPGYDLNIFAETIACLPNTPPSTMLTVSPLTMLLTDPTASPCHYISINNVIRKEFNSQGSSVSETVEKANTIAMNSLSSLRIASIPR